MPKALRVTPWIHIIDYKSVGYLGLIPFLTGAFLSFNVVTLPYNLEKYVYFCVNYAAIILSFMGGVLWGYELTKPSKHQTI